MGTQETQWWQICVFRQLNSVLAVGKSKRRHNEHTILHWSKEITYNLWVKNREIPSAHYSALIKWDHILPVGEKWQIPSAHDSASVQWDRVQPEGENGEIPWAHDSASTQWDHVLSMRMVYSCSAFIWQDNIPPACSTQVVTLRLSFRIHLTKLHTICEHNQMMHDEHAPLSLSCEITYGLWAEDGERPWAQHFLSVWWPYILHVSKKTRGHNKHITCHLSVHITYFLLAESTSNW